MTQYYEQLNGMPYESLIELNARIDAMFDRPEWQLVFDACARRQVAPQIGFTEAMTWVDRGKSARRKAWRFGEWLCLVDGKRTVRSWDTWRCGEYKPTERDMAAEDWEI